MSVINAVIKNFSTEQIAAKMKQRKIFVITNKNYIIGTASLEGDLVRTVFVLPSKQGKNAGSLLMHYLEEVARKKNISCLTVSFSITAEGIYKKLGIARYAVSTMGKKKLLSWRKNYQGFLSVRFRTIGLQTPDLFRFFSKVYVEKHRLDEAKKFLSY